MMDQLDEVTKRQNKAKSLRKKGDALRVNPDRKKEAQKAYRDGVAVLNDALEILDPETTIKQLKEMGPPPSGERGTLLGELVETYGARGGIFERLGLLEEALNSYSKGAVLEELFNLPGTYNRLNEVKYLLLYMQIF